MELRPPKPLRSAGTIGVLALSSTAKKETMATAIESLESLGFGVRSSTNIFDDERGYLAGNDQARVDALHQMLSDETIDAYFFSRGGYGISRILDRIDYGLFERNHRPVVGYSDVTALHQALANRGLASFHGPMLDFDIATGLSPHVSNWLWSILDGAAPMELPIDLGNVVRPGRAEGVLFGGCLSLTSGLTGTPFDFWIDDGIWFWEDVGEPAYRIDRMLTHLRLSGRFDSLRAVLIGGLRNCGDSPSELDLLASDFFADLGIPVLRDLPFGHHGDNVVLPVGRRVIVDTDSLVITFPDPAVTAGD